MEPYYIHYANYIFAHALYTYIKYVSIFCLVPVAIFWFIAAFGEINNWIDGKIKKTHTDKRAKGYNLCCAVILF